MSKLYINEQNTVLINLGVSNSNKSLSVITVYIQKSYGDLPWHNSEIEPCYKKTLNTSNWYPVTGADGCYYLVLNAYECDTPGPLIVIVKMSSPSAVFQYKFDVTNSEDRLFKLYFNSNYINKKTSEFNIYDDDKETIISTMKTVNDNGALDPNSRWGYYSTYPCPIKNAISNNNVTGKYLFDFSNSYMYKLTATAVGLNTRHDCEVSDILGGHVVSSSSVGEQLNRVYYSPTGGVYGGSLVVERKSIPLSSQSFIQATNKFSLMACVNLSNTYIDDGIFVDFYDNNKAPIITFDISVRRPTIGGYTRKTFGSSSVPASSSQTTAYNAGGITMVSMVFNTSNVNLNYIHFTYGAPDKPVKTQYTATITNSYTNIAYAKIRLLGDSNNGNSIAFNGLYIDFTSGTYDEDFFIEMSKYFFNNNASYTANRVLNTTPGVFLDPRNTYV